MCGGGNRDEEGARGEVHILCWCWCWCWCWWLFTIITILLSNACSAKFNVKRMQSGFTIIQTWSSGFIHWYSMYYSAWSTARVIDQRALYTLYSTLYTVEMEDDTRMTQHETSLLSKHWSDDDEDTLTDQPQAGWRMRPGWCTARLVSTRQNITFVICLARRMDGRTDKMTMGYRTQWEIYLGLGKFTTKSLV